jgi:hypothetical protein
MDFSLIAIHNKCWQNVICLHQTNNHVSHGGTLSKFIWWKFACNSGCQMVNPTHVLFQEQSKPFSCNIKPSTSRFDEFRSSGLYHTFEDGLPNTC